jgi:uncharacterized OB-fold protein
MDSSEPKTQEPVALLGDRWRPGAPPVLLAGRCATCGEVSFPPRPHCPACWEPARVIELPAAGSLYTFTIVHARGPGSAAYALGYADLGGLRVLGRLTGGPPAIGAPVTVTEVTVGRPTGGPAQVYAFQVGGR